MRDFGRALVECRGLGLLQTTWAGYAMRLEIVVGTEHYQFVSYVVAAESAWNGGKGNLLREDFRPDLWVRRAAPGARGSGRASPQGCALDLAPAANLDPWQWEVGAEDPSVLPEGRVRLYDIVFLVKGAVQLQGQDQAVRTTLRSLTLLTGRGDQGAVSDLQVQFGGRSEDVPVVGDFDGDGRADLGVFTPSSGLWNLDFDRDGTADQTFVYGGAGDLPVAGDFDGDRRDDPGLFRPSTGRWYLLTVRDASGPVSDEQFYYGGDPTDIPVIGDFNGDRLSDPGLYRRGTGVFYLLVGRTDGQPTNDYQFRYGGDPSDLPLTSAALLAPLVPFPGDLPDDMVGGSLATAEVLSVAVRVQRPVHAHLPRGRLPRDFGQALRKERRAR